MTRNTSATLVIGLAALVLGGILLAHYGAALRPLGRSAAKPAYARMVVSRDGSKILNIAFMEANGSGCYDVAYADTNFDGRFSESEKITGSLTKGWMCKFCDMKSATIHESPFAGCPSKSRLLLTTGRRKGIWGRDTDRVLLILASDNILSKGWGYGAKVTLEPAPDLRSARIVRLNETPRLVICTEPGRQGRDSIGISLHVVIGKDISLIPFKDAHRPPATIMLTNYLGRVITSKTATLDVFKSRRRGGKYSVRVPKGRYTIHASVDTGPLAGVLTATRAIVVR